jgi:hypothetical protein
MTTETDATEAAHPTSAQRKWLARGLSQPGGKLPLFDETGRRVSQRMVQTCIEHGWAEPWFANPLMPAWQVCRLTAAGRALFAARPKPEPIAQSAEPQLLL